MTRDQMLILSERGIQLRATPSGGTSRRPNSPDEIAAAFQAGVVVAIATDSVLPVHPEATWFDVEPGGQRPGFGTANALITLDNGDVEPLTVHDAAAASQAGVRRQELMEYLAGHDGGLIGYATACDSLEAVRLRGGNANPRLDIPPLAMTRRRPDGSTVRWRLLVPGRSTWYRPWPFLIEWADPRGPSVPERSASHPNGASAIDAMVVGTTSVDHVAAFYGENPGIVPRTPRSPAGDTTPRMAVDVGGCRIEFLEAPRTAAPGPLRSTANGEGVVELRIHVPSVGAVGRLLNARGIAVADSGASGLHVQRSEAFGAPIAFVE